MLEVRLDHLSQAGNRLLVRRNHPRSIEPANLAVVDPISVTLCEFDLENCFRLYRINNPAVAADSLACGDDQDVRIVFSRTGIGHDRRYCEYGERECKPRTHSVLAKNGYSRRSVGAAKS